MYRNGQKSISKNILFVVTAGGTYGYGNLTRSLHLSKLIAEKGHKVSFVVSNKAVIHTVEEMGFNVVADASLGKKLWNKFDTVVFDIGHTISISEIPNTKTVFIDNINGAATKANKIIYTNTYYDGKKLPNLVYGKDYIVIRDEIKSMQPHSQHKEIDILFYTTTIPSIIRALEKEGYKITAVKRFRSDFPLLLAKSRVLISGFGISFYEALFLKATPVVYTLSKAHIEAAKKFYRSLSIKPLITSENNLEVIKTALDYSCNIKIKDGSKNVVDKILSV